MRLTALVCGACLLISCGGGNNSPVAATPGMAYGITLTNLEIATALYLDSQRTPSGFLGDPVPPAAGLVATHHLQSVELGMATAASFEVCTNDWNQALSWSEQAAGAGNNYANLVGTNDTSHYFEFDRTRPGTPSELLRQRVYLCSYLDRSDSSADVASGPAGVFNVQPRTAAQIRDLSEYLWRFTSWNNFGSAVLASVADSQAGGLGHTLVVATLVRDVVSSGCDRIDVLGWRHTLDITSGALQRSLATLWSFSAHQSGSGATACTG